MDKRALSIGTYLIGILVFGALLTGILSLLKEFDTAYPLPEGYAGNLSSLDKFEETSQTIQDIGNQTRSDDLTAVGFFTKGSWAAMQLVMSTFSFFGDIVTITSTIIGIPDWVGGLIIGIILISIILVIASAIFRYDLL